MVSIPNRRSRQVGNLRRRRSCRVREALQYRESPMLLSEPGPSPHPVRDRTILIADDDSAILALVAAVLRQDRFSVVSASDGIQALELARRHGSQIDLLLTDLDMPHMDGVQLAAAIRQLLPRIGIVVMSGTPTRETAGDLTFLAKPFTPAELLETVRRSLKR